MESKPKEVLIIDPPTELHFTGPFVRPVVTVMRLSNPTEHTVLFKIKTTAPKRYCVRPNFGLVHPHDFTRVDIVLQPFVYDANEKNKHKFMVQSLIAPENYDEDLNKVWKEAEPDSMMDAKLKCVFDMPQQAVSQASETSQSAAANDYSKDINAKSAEEQKTSNLAAMEKAEQMISEMRGLREENSNLRKDNVNLKEQVMRLRATNVASAKPPMDEPYRPLAVAEKPIPMFYIATSVAVAIFCLLLGKYLL